MLFIKGVDMAIEEKLLIVDGGNCGTARVKCWGCAVSVGDERI